MRRVILVAVTACATLAACNAILDNKVGTLVVTEEAGTEPTPEADAGPAPTPTATTPPAPPPPVDAGNVDAGSPCAAGEKSCNGACVDAADPRYGCASAACVPCATAHGTATCAAGACAIQACDPGFADCDTRPENGCEVDLSRATSCGTCTTVCPPTTPLCTPQGAAFVCTNGCPITAPVLCGKDCVDPLTSVTSCGGCNQKCADVANATVACTLGVCVATCRPGYHLCGAKCVPTTDVTACGAACAACPAIANGKPACTADACAATCNPGFADCDLNLANGCEARLATDAANCGACGQACAAGLVCTAGVCVAPPDAGPPPH